MKQYRILIFDLDDTLIDNFQNVKHAFQKTIGRKDLPYSEEEFLRWYKIDKNFWRDWQDGKIEVPKKYKLETGKKSDEFLDWLRSQRVLRFFRNQVSPDEAIQINNAYMEALKENVVAVDGAKEVLKYLSQKYQIVVATNGPSIAAKDKLKKINCLQYVEYIFSADMFGYMKPREEFFKGIQKSINNYKNEDYLIIGDSLRSDIKLAINCGVDSCWFNKKKEKRKTQDTLSTTFTIERLAESKRLL